MGVGGETFWLFLSLLQSPLDVQLNLIEGIPEEGDTFEKNHDENPMSLLISVMQSYYNGWFDEFYPNCKYAEQFFDHLNAMDSTPMNKKSFVSTEYWCALRRIAKLVLDESGLGLCELPEKIIFDDYIEVIRSS